MKTVLRSVGLVLAVAAFLGGCSRTAYLTLADWGLVPDDFRYGDLYRLSNLPQFKQERETCPSFAKNTSNVPITLHVIGDSFLEPGRVDSADFVAKNYRYVHWESRAELRLDSNSRNILLIETVERHAREHFARMAENYVQPGFFKPEKKEAGVWSDVKTFFTGTHEKRQRLPEEQLENLLFNTIFWQKLKEFKARLTLAWFDRTNPKVALSRDQRHLFYVLDTDSTLVNSNFNPLPDAEVDSMVRHLNETADFYKKRGFAEVWLSIIPNKTTVVEPHRGPYNRLIERVQQDPQLGMPVIDAYGLLKPGGAGVYELSDSHWNCRGRALWLDAVNNRLIKSASR
jgi:hypothetical protein